MEINGLEVIPEVVIAVVLDSLKAFGVRVILMVWKFRKLSNFLKLMNLMNKLLKLMLGLRLSYSKG